MSLLDDIFQSTLSMRRATVVDAAHFVAIVISIHALHEESDDGVAAEFVHALVISIHALHEESDPTAWRTVQSSSEFQSTLSMRRATHPYPRAHLHRAISIHALHEESDTRSRCRPSPCWTFQSTLSMRRATRREHARASRGIRISIHALHEESDSVDSEL